MNTTEQKQQLHELAEAMRQGAKLRPQGFGRLFDCGCSCAMGAVLEFIRPDIDIPGSDESVGFREIAEWERVLAEYYPVLKLQIKTSDRELELYRAIIRKNDHLQMSREQIADWIPTVELVQVDN